MKRSLEMWILILLFMAVKTCHGQSTDKFISVNPDTNMLVDNLGRERFFHGTNVVVKGYPYYPLPTGEGHDVFNETDMKLLQSLGLNSVRLGMILYSFYIIDKQSLLDEHESIYIYIYY